MNGKIFSKAFLSLFFIVMFSGCAAAQPAAVTKYVVEIPQKYYVHYNGAYKQDFPNGFVAGFGSGLCLKSINKDGSIDFYGITDRGPNGDGPWYNDAGQKKGAKFFPSPSFQPSIGIIRVKDGKAEIVDTIGLKTTQGQTLSGLPITPGLVGATNEIALDENFRNLGYDDNGMDTEGIALGPDKDFWTCDEYGPFLTHFDRQGTMVKNYGPGEGLPEILKNRIPNRGFEGVTVTPSGMVYGLMQSPLDIDGVTSQTSRFTRIVQLDPQSGKTAMFAYPIEDGVYKKPKDIKLGDIFAISEHKMLVIEQGEDKDSTMRNLIYLIDLTNATDISDMKIDGQELEFITDQSKLSEIRFADKKLVYNLRANGWEAEKAEGLTMLPDQKTIVVTNDNDFGMSIDTEDNEHPGQKITKYTLSPDGSFTYKDKSAHPHISIKPNDEVNRKQYLWMLVLPEPLQ